MSQVEKNICEHCSYENPKGALICRRCYRMLSHNGRSSTTVPQGTTHKLGTKRLDGSAFDAIDEPHSQSEDNPLFNGTLRIRVVESDAEIVKNLRGGTLLLGRADAARRIRPDVDLNPHNAYAYGVSRTHALLRRERDRLLIQDLDSANYTYLNGERLAPHTPTEVRHGDVIRMGMFVVEIYFK